MFHKMKVKRNFVEWLAEILPEYQHEDASRLGDNIRKCLDTSAREFEIAFKPVKGLKAMKVDLKDPKMLVKSYFHNLVLIKIKPHDVGSHHRSA